MLQMNAADTGKIVHTLSGIRNYPYFGKMLEIASVLR